MSVVEVFEMLWQNIVAAVAQPKDVFALIAGAVAAVLHVTSTLVKTIIPLRWLAVGSSIGFVIYGLVQPAWLVLALAAATATGSDVALAQTDLSRLVARDPFSPLRAAPDVAYQIGVLPSDRPAVVERPTVRLLGTILRAGGRSFAMCQLANQPVRMVYAGERIGTLTLETVSQGGAVFIDDSGARVTLRVARTGE